MLGRREEYIKMSEVEVRHWWYRSLHYFTLESIERKFSEKKDILIIDAGCGTGGLISFLQKRGYNNIKGFDLSHDAVEICISKKLDVFNDSILNAGNNFAANYADIIISNDNFYFLSEDERKEAACQFHKILKPGGIVILNIPAFAIFRGIHDKSVGITYRFSKKDIWTIFEEKDFLCIQSFYWPFVLFPFIFFVRLFQRIKMRLYPATLIKSDIALPAKLFNTFLFKAISAERKLLPGKFKLIGSSLFLVMEKK
jgi:SAM-dependent methyltransferase